MLKERKCPLLCLPFRFTNKNNATSRCGMSRFRWKKFLKARCACVACPTANTRATVNTCATAFGGSLRLVALLRRTYEVFQESRLLQHLVHRLLQITSTKVLALVLQHIGKRHQIDPTRSQRHGIECATH